MYCVAFTDSVAVVIMKIKTISRSGDDYVPTSNEQTSKTPRNLNPALHPFERAREYTRALTATKLERLFAQPFVGQLGSGHRDGIYSISTNMGTTNQIATALGDGIIKYWNLTDRDNELLSVKAHYGMVGGLCVIPGRQNMLSCGDDKTIKLWLVNVNKFGENVTDHNDEQLYKSQGLEKTFLGDHAFKGIDHHYTEGLFVTGGALIQLWDMNRSKHISDLNWGYDNLNTVKFNKTETNIVASSGGSDNLIILYDIRTNSAVQKVVTNHRTNCLSWNPIEAFNFASGSEDHNAYLWDMRKLDSLLNVYKDHVLGVMDVDFSPTGQELVTGSYDKTIRIFNSRSGHSREIYHTKRMQHVFVAKFTMDSKYIISGSDDTNVRIWRVQAHDRASVKLAKQRTKMEYDDALKEKYKHMPEIKRIARHRHVPKVVKKAQEIKRVELESIKRREDNQRRHRKPGAVPYVAERKKHVRGIALKEDK